MTVEKHTPEVRAAHAFREISRDFTTPAEIFREAIANSLDAYARRIWLRVCVRPTKGRETVFIDMSDDGVGMSKETMKAFLNLSDSRKDREPPKGMTARRMTGHKGHGTKIFLNSERLDVLTYDGTGPALHCTMIDPRGELADGNLPIAEVEEVSLEKLRELRANWGFSELAGDRGTSVRVTGYHNNSKSGLEHALLRDYVCWFTRWGSWEPKLAAVTKSERPEVADLARCKLYLRGLGKEPDPDGDEDVAFGHVFPAMDCTDLRKLRATDDSDPLKYYVRTWGFPNQPLVNNPEKRVDFLFAIEGEGARRDYNGMLRRQGKPRRAGDYLSEERYGLWLGRDFVPIERFNDWVAERSEYTRMHAFANCQDLHLTANRGSIENTPQELLRDIRLTVQKLFEEQVQPDEDYVKFRDEMQMVERHRHAKKEGEDYKRRQKRLESKEAIRVGDVELYTPTSELDLIALTASVQALVPDILPFVVREYDAHFGFDGLATRNGDLAINESKHLFVEFKLDLKRDFNHSFDRLEAIVCWGARVKDGEEVTDLAGKKGTYRISMAENGQKARYIVLAGSPRNVEVLVFRELLDSRGYSSRPVGE
jgi:hypothetical protein